MRLGFFILFILGLLFGCSDEVSNWPKATFQQKIWSETKDLNRFVYIRDLIEGKKLIGKSKGEIYRILGKPEYDDPNDSYMTYVVDEDQIEFYVMHVQFNNESPNPRVKEVFVRTP